MKSNNQSAGRTKGSPSHLTNEVRQSWRQESSSSTSGTTTTTTSLPTTSHATSAASKDPSSTGSAFSASGTAPHIVWSAESVASLPSPGMGAPTGLVFLNDDCLAFCESTIKRKSFVTPKRSIYAPLSSSSSSSSSGGGQQHSHTTTIHSERTLRCVNCSSASNDPTVPSTSQSLLLPFYSFRDPPSRQGVISLGLPTASFTQFNFSPPAKGRQAPVLWVPTLSSSRSSGKLPSTGSSDTSKTVTNDASSTRNVTAHPPIAGFVQYGVHDEAGTSYEPVTTTNNIPIQDAQISPCGTLIAWPYQGNLYIQSISKNSTPTGLDSSTKHYNHRGPTIRLTYCSSNLISLGTTDFIAQEEMDRTTGFWWHPFSLGIVLTKVDNTDVPVVQIGDSNESSTQYYPFCGTQNPSIKLGFLRIDPSSIHASYNPSPSGDVDMREEADDCDMRDMSETSMTAQEIAKSYYDRIMWFEPPREASEYLARVQWVNDECCIAQWQNRLQNTSVWANMNIMTGKSRTLLVERSNSSDTWINLHQNFVLLDTPVHSRDCEGLDKKRVPPFPADLPRGSFSFITTSEKSGFAHMLLYTYIPGLNNELAMALRTISAGEWMVDKVVGTDQSKDLVYFTGTYDSPLERHLYVLPICKNQHRREDEKDRVPSPNGVRLGFSTVINAFKHRENVCTEPLRLTEEAGMHSIVMNPSCEFFVDSGSDLGRPTSVRVFRLAGNIMDGCKPELVHTLYDASRNKSCLLDLPEEPISKEKTPGQRLLECLPPPEVLTFPTLDGTETLYANIYKPNSSVYGPGPYPLICAVYGGPHVQRVNRSWGQSADMRAQRLCSMGFCVVKCDNRGSSRRGMAFETAISRRLGKLEVLDQVAAVRQLTMRGIADASRVGVYGWSYGGYLATMCLCRAPDVFHVAVAGAPVTSWDGYDTHYTERYMGLPQDNRAGFRESAVFEHIPNMRGKLLIVHGLIDENVHFRHTTRLINKLVASGKDYDLLIFPEERHSPRRLRDRIYMEQRISDFFVKHLGKSALEMISSVSHSDDLHAIRNLAGRL